MKHFKKLLNEAHVLTVFEMLKKLETFLKDKYGIKSFGVKKDNNIVMYMSRYIDKNREEKDLSDEIKGFVTRECELDSVDVHKDTYGYHITFGHDVQSAKLIEVTQATGTGMTDSKKTYVCTFCGKEYKGYGNDPWPLDTNPLHRVCDACNLEYVIPERKKALYSNKRSRKEAVDKREVEHATSNIVLDDKFIWLFSVMDKNGRDIEEGIEYLQDAIDVLIKHNAAFLVAFPYVDPNPEDDSVDLVFADNPGPVTIYNNEEVTVPKRALKKPEEEPQKKEKVEESVFDYDYEEPEYYYVVIKNDEIVENGIEDIYEAIAIARSKSADYVVKAKEFEPIEVVWERGDSSEYSEASTKEGKYSKPIDQLLKEKELIENNLKEAEELGYENLVKALKHTLKNLNSKINRLK